MKKQLIFSAVLSTALLGSGSAWAETADDVDCNGCVRGNEIAKQTITQKNIAKDSIGELKIKNNAVSTDKIKDRAVTADKLSDELGAAINDHALRIEALEYDENNFPPVLELNITPINAIVGETVSINGESSVIEEFSFRRFDTDEMYVLEMPSRATNTNISASLVRSPSVGSAFGSPGSVNSYSFSVNGFESRMEQMYSVGVNTFLIQGESQNTSQQQIIESISILVGSETLLRITYFIDLVRTETDLTSDSNKSEIESVMSGSLDYLPYFEIRPAI